LKYDALVYMYNGLTSPQPPPHPENVSPFLVCIHDLPEHMVIFAMVAAVNLCVTKLSLIDPPTPALCHYAKC